MTDARPEPTSGGSAHWFGIAAFVLLLDQITKIAIIQTFQFGEFHPVTPFFNLVLVYNTGAAFSFLADAGGWQRWFFTVFGIGASLVIAWLLKRRIGTKLFCLALALILGGAIGNVIDRLLYGHVIDFFDFYIGRWHWPAFNIADAGITVGAMLLLADEILRSRNNR